MGGCGFSVSVSLHFVCFNYCFLNPAVTIVKAIYMYVGFRNKTDGENSSAV